LEAKVDIAKKGRPAEKTLSPHESGKGGEKGPAVGAKYIFESRSSDKSKITD